MAEKAKEQHLKARWQVRKRKSADLLEHLCLLRGFNHANLMPDYKLNLHDPNLLPDMPAARKLIVEASQQGWFVTVFGDYDADGTPAAALLSELLTTLGIDHEVILPTRLSGYGLNLQSIEELNPKTKLLITVDTGITAVNEIKRAKEKGIKTIILDHHLPHAELPSAEAIVDPYLPTSNYPFKQLCGCALAFKLADALRPDFPDTLTENFIKWQLDLVAISTVADMMSLIDENRTFVHYGLKVLQKNRRAGLRALLEIAAINPETITASTLGFALGPRLNASGRMGDNRPALELLLSQDAATAGKWAQQIEEANRLRQSMVQTVLEEAAQLIFVQNLKSDPIYTLFKADWPTGLVGLVAGKLASQYYRPVIVAGKQGDEVRASARSTDRYSIVDGLTSQADRLLRFGGHKQAAGLSVAEEGWADFCSGIKQHAAEKLSESDFVPFYIADALLEDQDLTLQSAQLLEKLQPFGLGNSKPLMIIPLATTEEVRFIGARGNHLKVKLAIGARQIDGIGFDLAERYKKYPIKHAQLLGYLENNQWNNRNYLQFQIIDYLEPGASIETVDD